MNPADLIKNILTMIDTDDREKSGQLSPLSNTPSDAEPNREKQIVDLVPDHECDQWQNEPEEKYADIDSVTIVAGGGVNGPKNPADIRVQHPSAYPTAQDHEPKRVSIYDTLMQMLGGK